MQDQQIVIVGGGVSGLYCAVRLAEAGHPVLILESSSDRWGGRIETEDMDGFIAEYGPMRFEPTLQPRFARLCAELGVRLVDFSGPSADAIVAPDHDLPPEEQGLNSLQLLKRGIMLIMGRDPSDQGWIDGLTEADYQRLRKHAQMHGQPLWATGFWNAMSAHGVLSHRALVKLRDTGTFYHMIPENLNAIEWIIWWLRALKTVGQKLASIEGGSAKLTDGLMAKIHSLPNITVAGGHTLLGFRPTGLGQSSMELEVRTKNGSITLRAARLILAMPRLPLLKLAPHLPEHIAGHLDAVNGFPMLKIFFVSNAPWWDYDQPPQQYANCLPTREVHYFRRAQDGDHDGHGMVLLYMDRPSTEFWRHYLSDPERHDRAEVDQDARIVDAFAVFVARDVKRLLETNDQHLKLNAHSKAVFRAQTLDEATAYIRNSIITYGIRDWARAPYGAANHGWQPGVRSWKVMEAFRAFDFGSGAKNVHIVGEAYSDYQGFVEGALNSAELALATIARPCAPTGEV
ncbi:flavin monoamine oxidase family protein [Massilia glaciei]|uniref:Tryptophan 2-monooxygenase n=1 Tax=Massilia glaciei TaxID=1524097 RepID=A0A2U2HHP8_9BURK|nr:FAD-dependent oxidoreductase [Massilia glaciei]PWF45446.1 FAD-dependent oxidoreductase [Massilia glaciei]